jgi:hypothetical protein
MRSPIGNDLLALIKDLKCENILKIMQSRTFLPQFLPFQNIPSIKLIPTVTELEQILSAIIGAEPIPLPRNIRMPDLDFIAISIIENDVLGLGRAIRAARRGNRNDQHLETPKLNAQIFLDKVFRFTVPADRKVSWPARRRIEKIIKACESN